LCVLISSNFPEAPNPKGRTFEMYSEHKTTKKYLILGVYLKKIWCQR